MQMMGMVNAMERTYDQFKVLLEAAGWKISSVHANDACPSVFPHIESGSGVAMAYNVIWTRFRRVFHTVFPYVYFLTIRILRLNPRRSSHF